MRVRRVNINSVVVYKDRRRALNEDAVDKLADSIERTGLQNPITVHQRFEGSPLYLTAGYHRLEACKLLGHNEIRATVAMITELEAKLVEIEENLIRQDLTSVQEAIAIDRRTELIKVLEEEIVVPNGTPKKRGGNAGVSGPAPASVRDLAGKTGLSKTSINRAQKRVESIGADTLETIVGTCLDQPGELDALAEMQENERSAVIDKACTGEKVSAKIELKKIRRKERETELAAKQTALPNKKYGVIVADPEWRLEPWSRETGMDRAADNHYPTSCTEVIVSRDVPSIAADDCVLFLWATVPMLPQALVVMEAWGFEYKSHLVWMKDRIGTGYWNRNRHELLLIGTKGKIPAPAPGTQPDSVIPVLVGKHSAKPEKFLEMIEAYFPNLPKIELNRRGPPRSNWDAGGNDTDSFGAVA